MPRLFVVACLVVALPLAGCEHEHHDRDVRSEHHAGNSYAKVEEGRELRSEEHPVSEYPEYEVSDASRHAVPKPMEDRAAAVRDPTLEGEIAKYPDSSPPRWVRDPGWMGDHPLIECFTNTATVVVIGVVVVGLVVLYLVAEGKSN